MARHSVAMWPHQFRPLAWALVSWVARSFSTLSRKLVRTCGGAGERGGSVRSADNWAWLLHSCVCHANWHYVTLNAALIKSTVLIFYHTGTQIETHNTKKNPTTTKVPNCAVTADYNRYTFAQMSCWCYFFLLWKYCSFQIWILNRVKWAYTFWLK